MFTGNNKSTEKKNVRKVIEMNANVSEHRWPFKKKIKQLRKFTTVFLAFILPVKQSRANGIQRPPIQNLFETGCWMGSA